jgi:threonine/homoserine/homoserine lactone efflux protein
MDPTFFLKGIAIGFSIAAPVGPIGLLCIRRSLAGGQWVGLATGLGAATADAAYGLVAAFGLTAVSDFLVGQRFWLGLLGGAFLCYLGARTFAQKPAEQAAEARGDSLLAAYASTFLLTLTNPMTILSFVAVFAGFGLGSSPDYLAATTLVIGVFAGSALWWLLLSGGVGLFRSRIGPAWMQAVNRLSGAVIFGFGVYALVTAFRD